MRKKIIYFIIISLTLIMSCTGKNENTDLSKLFKYSIINEDKMNGVKTMINIRIAKEVEKEKLYEFTQSYHKIFVNTPRLFINFYLPKMIVGEGSWASSQSDGSKIEVSIYGFTKDQSEEITNIQDNVIAKWKWNIIGAMIYLRKDDNKYTLEILSEDGSSLKKDVILSRVNGIVEIREIEKNIHGDYYKISLNGDLEFWDAEGKSGSAVVEKPLKIDF